MGFFNVFMLVAFITPFLATVTNYNAAVAKCEEKLGKITPDMEKTERIQRLKCLYACEMKELGTMTADGAYDATPVTKEIGEVGSSSFSFWARFFPSVRECGAESRVNDHCETAAKFYDCLKTIQTSYDFETKAIIDKFVFLIDASYP